MGGLLSGRTLCRVLTVTAVCLALSATSVAPDLPVGGWKSQSCMAAVYEALGIWAEVAPFAAQTDNVRTALAFVARGESPLGIVYATDAAAEPRVAIVATFDAALHPAIIYPAAVVAGADGPAVSAFFAYLAGPEAGAVFAAHGFSRPQAP